MTALSRAPGDNAWLRLDRAYGGLSASAARTFRLLAIHPGPDMSAAAVAALTDLSVSDAKDALERLVQAQLVETPAKEDERWHIRSPAREYVQRLSDALAGTDGREQARDRLIEYYLFTAEAADELLRGLPAIAAPEKLNSRKEALAWLDSEWLCLIATVRMAADTGRQQATASLPLLMAQYLDFRGRFDELITIATTGLTAARCLGDRAAEGEALTNLGLALFAVHRLDEAVRAHEAAVAIFREMGDQQDEGAARNNLGLALHGLDRNSEAIRAHQDAAAIFRETLDRLGEGKALNNLGLALHGLDRNSEAIRAHQEAAAIFREVGYNHEEAKAMANLGKVLNEIGLSEEAGAAYQKAADIFRETGDDQGELKIRQTLRSIQKMS